MITKNITIKSTLLIVVTILFAVVANAQIEMNSSGNVGIGKTPQSYDLTVGSFKIDNGSYSGIIGSNGGANYGSSIYPTKHNSGQIGLSNQAFTYVYAYYKPTISDKRKKENITEIGESLSKIMKLSGVKYDYKKEGYFDDSQIKDSKRKAKVEYERKNKLGFLAQDVQEVLPEVVMYDDSTDVYMINYEHIIPVLVEAMKEQQVQIEQLQSSINKGNKNKSATLGDVTNESGNTLAQNAPNPFTEQTSISYTLAENVNDAMICIYDMHGTQLKCYPLSLEGSGSITINGNELVAGMYMYALIADGQLIDTKNMVLTE